MKSSAKSVSVLHKNLGNNESSRRIWIRAMNTENFTPIVRTMLRDGVAKSSERAMELITAFMQWISVSTSSGKKPYLMFRGPVDKTFHCFILNTEFYARFCEKNFGKFINHNPLDSDMAKIVVARGGIRHTIQLLKNNFGNELHPELQKWVRAEIRRKLNPSSVSCVHCDD